ncbi:hypothetical protein Syun_030535 [Stephania yunnanensis]|uniref:glucose-6-phosphate dehydrogenase (NADP(+)) n=1 Tax=Stephania yunnanensis TaxID=152371 RepID=A0AAP0DXW1_9MAGN
MAHLLAPSMPNDHSLVSALDQAFEVYAIISALDQQPLYMQLNLMCQEVSDIISIIGEPKLDIISDENMNELYDPIEQLFVEMLHSFIDRLPEAIFNSINESVPSDEFEINAKNAVKLIAKLNLVDAKSLCFTCSNMTSFMTTDTAERDNESGGSFSCVHDEDVNLRLPSTLEDDIEEAVLERLKQNRDMLFTEPFGKDLDTSEESSTQLGDLFDEKQLYRIDHYLGKELVQNLKLSVLRFANRFFLPLWNRDNIDNIQDDFPLFRIGSTGASLFTAGSKWMDMKNIVMVSDFMG